MRVKWYGTPKLDRLLARNVARAGGNYADAVIKAISIQGPPRSDPGSPPHIDTMQLINSIDVMADMDPAYPVAQISSDVAWSVYLEIGTVNMAARPFWIPTLVQDADSLARTICNV